MAKPEVIRVNGYAFVSYVPPAFTETESIERSRQFYHELDERRSVRDFSAKPVAREIIEHIILSASTAPSGAHKQPWTFCLVSNPDLKKQIRLAAEKEEYESYHHRMSEEWLQDLAPLGTSWEKPFLEIAPCLIVVFKRIYEESTDGAKKNNYYVNESVGLACGMLLAAIHHAGLVALTHTPSPMNFLSSLLQRPANERPFLLIPVGYPAEKTYVPDITRKTLPEILVRYD